MLEYDTIPVITVDGPSGSGKGTISRLLAAQLGFHWLDSGVLYRVLALAARRLGVAFTDPQALAELTARFEITFRQTAAGEPAVWLGGEDVTVLIRSETCGKDASRVAALSEVRAALLERQRALRKRPGLVADGRDMGTVVFPDAVLKVYLSASLEERARRRFKQLLAQGVSATLEKTLNDLAQRDARDFARTAAPLKPARDAVIVDSTHLGIEAVVQQCVHLAKSVLYPSLATRV